MSAPEDNTHEDMLRTFESTENPYFVWFEIDRCLEANKPLPTWVLAYLAQCAGRMLSEKARQTSDLRMVLPWVLGFPKKRAELRLGAVATPIPAVRTMHEDIGQQCRFAFAGRR
jgi:hypothetical protein